ncbi:MAG: Acetoin:2,6-dichlorophenolindophenol oxidoreductase subunit alpha [Chlamydiae bacterium]|nr:Acetoin:2,6-dichlorophenolindophenol oxidoreductase subunit alpha [Chlamydiota bacterium]
MTKDYTFYSCDREKQAKSLKKDQLLKCLENMVLIRIFEMKAEMAYLKGKMGGFFHSYQGQEAIMTALYEVFGPNHWYASTYRCHGAALTLGASCNEVMAELFGKSTGNAKGRGGSMHLYHENLLGGFGIVGGQIPVATGAAFSSKYLKNGKMALCFLGDGTIPQGSFHESLNMASLWDLPCLYIIENNIWGMGTHFKDANCISPLAEKIAPRYDMEYYTIDGVQFFDLVTAFKEIYEKMKKTSRPILIEVVTNRFRGHSISDPGIYRSKEDVKHAMQNLDPIKVFKEQLLSFGLMNDTQFDKIENVCEKKVLDALEFAEKSPWPDPVELEEDVFAK